MQPSELDSPFLYTCVASAVMKQKRPCWEMGNGQTQVAMLRSVWQVQTAPHVCTIPVNGASLLPCWHLPGKGRHT